MATNLGRWDRQYGLIESDVPCPYGHSESYTLGAQWLEPCSLVEDWGCGMGWLRTIIPAAKYRGIDGSASRFADEVVDLATYRSSVPGVFMRHVIEHDWHWRDILDNALHSFTERMALIIFTPFSEVTHDIEWEPDPGVPNLSFSRTGLRAAFDAAGVNVGSESFESPATKYGIETVFRIWR